MVSKKFMGRVFRRTPEIIARIVTEMDQRLYGMRPDPSDPAYRDAVLSYAKELMESGFTINDREILRYVVNNYLTQHESGNKYGELNPMDIYRLGSLNGAFEILARH